LGSSSELLITNRFTGLAGLRPTSPVSSNVGCNEMNIEKGFNIESPPVFIPWSIGQRGLRKLLCEHGLRHVTAGYFCMSCVSMGGLSHELGFHFRSRWRSRLAELEFFRKSYPDQRKSYDDFQRRFEAVFGPPTRREEGSEGFDTCTWSLGVVEIVHCVYERFVLEEHMRIRYHG
jgi:hypothetical protein